MQAAATTELREGVMKANEPVDQARRHSATICEMLRSISTLMQFPTVERPHPRDEALLYLVQHTGELAEELDRVPN
jgi:hypothetical protein